MVRISPEEVIAQRHARDEIDTLSRWKHAGSENSARIEMPLDNLQAVQILAANLGLILSRRDKPISAREFR